MSQVGIAPTEIVGIENQYVDTMRVVADYRVWLRASYSEKTVGLYLRTVVRFLTETGKAFDEVTELDAATWLERYPFRSSARRTYYQGLLTFYGWAKRNRYMKHNPVGGIRVPPVVVKQPRSLTREELLAIVQAAHRRAPYRAYAILFLYHSGCRLDEMRHVRWDDLREDGVLLRKTKTGAERTIPWSDGLRAASEGLRRYFGDEDYLVPRSHQTVWSWCRMAGTDAGVENVHPHLFRSTAASLMLKRGARVHAVRSVLGHDNIRTTSRYLADDEEDRETAVGLL